jgi:hypothetical protein
MASPVTMPIRPTKIDVRFGSLADVLPRDRRVRFTPESGHVQRTSSCPLWANNRHTVG